VVSQTQKNVIQLKTTMRYMHLSPHGTDHMIRVLERGPGVDQMLDRPQI